VLSGHFKRTLGHDGAVVLDGEHYVLQSVYFGELFRGNLNFLLFADVAVELFLVAFLALFGSLFLLLVFGALLALFSLLELACGLASEERVVLVNEVLVLVV